jgi:hypothetical protein
MTQGFDHAPWFRENTLHLDPVRRPQQDGAQQDDANKTDVKPEH